MIRSWGIVTLTGAAQPWFGDVTTAAVALPQGNGIIPVTVAATKRYRVGDRLILDPEQTNQDVVMVSSIPSSTVLNCVSEGQAVTHTHISGAIVQLSIAVEDVILQAVDGNTAAVWLGSDNTVTVAGGSAFHQLQKVASGAVPQEWREAGEASDANIVRTSDGWMIGTLNDKVGVASIVL